MTWAEFKDHMDRQGLKDTDEIAHIDWSDRYEPVVVGWEKNRKTIVDGREAADQPPEENHGSH